MSDTELERKPRQLARRIRFEYVGGDWVNFRSAMNARVNGSKNVRSQCYNLRDGRWASVSAPLTAAEQKQALTMLNRLTIDLNRHDLKKPYLKGVGL